jgi:hypothetical protein
MAFLGVNNRFNEFRADFVKDTGLTSVDENIDLYIAYVTARFTDQNNRLLTNMSNEVMELHKVLKKV